MREPEQLDGLRLVATSAAIDAARWSAGALVLRLAPDDAFAIGATEVDVADPHAIVERETAFVGWWITHDEFHERVSRHVEWALPTNRPALAQGLVAAIPMKLWFGPERVLLVASAGLAHEVMERLS